MSKNNIEKNWIVLSNDPVLQCALSRKLGISPTIAGLLINKGISTAKEARQFFDCSLDTLESPWLLSGIDKAVKRIFEAKENGEKVTIFGDYDCDGLTATALLLEAFRKIEIKTDYYLPDRIEEGYGINKNALLEIKNKGSNLVVTVDCGITAIEEVLYAQELDLDVIITDHHEPAENLPSCTAIINPKLGLRDTPFYDLAGVGVAFKLAQALLEAAGFSSTEIFESFLDIVALGTIADIVPLTGENRIFVKNGLKKIASTKRVGLKALVEVAGIDINNISTADVAFRIAPRLNAAGRIGNPRIGVELLTTTSIQNAREFSKELNRENQKRQIIEKQILNEAEALLIEEFDFKKDKVIVLASSFWHSGVIGIVASKLVEKYYRPVILIAIENGEGKGSARSIPGFDIYDALKNSSEHLLKYGGHKLAAGLSIAPENISQFKEAINVYAKKHLTDDKLIPNLTLSGEIFSHEIDENFLQQIEKLAPFGEGNPKPIFMYKGAKVVDYRPVGNDGSHLKMRVEAGGREFDSIGFNLFKKKEALTTKEIDIAFSVEENFWQGQKKIQLNLKDISKKDKKIFLKDSSLNIEIDNAICNEKRELFYDTSQKMTEDLLNLIFKTILEGKNVILVGITPGLIGSFYSAYREKFIELNIPHELLKGSYLDKEIFEIENAFLNFPGLLCTDLFSIKLLSEKLFCEERSLVIFLGTETEEINFFEKESECKNYFKILLNKKDSLDYNVCVEDLHRIIGKNKKTIIYCSTKKEVLDLKEKFLENDIRDIIYHHPGMSYNKQVLALEMFRQGLVNYLITTTTVGVDRIGTFERIFFNSLPFDITHYHYLLENNKEKTPEVFISNSAHVNMTNIIEAMYPSKKTVAYIYNYFKKYGIKDIKGCLLSLKRNGILKANLETIRFARAILMEKTAIENTKRFKVISWQRKQYQKLFEMLKI